LPQGEHDARVGLVPVLPSRSAALEPLERTSPEQFVQRHSKIGIAMHALKNTILYALSVALLSVMVSCAGSSNGEAASVESKESASVKDAKHQEREQDKKAMLEQMFVNFQNAIRMNVDADTLLAMMTDTSEYWIDSLELHARTYTEENLDTCQFYEVYAILLYRLYEREHLFVSPDDKMVYLLLSKSGMVNRLTNLKLGPMEVKNDRGSIGLASSPKVPIMIFEWDDSVWKLNLPQTLPLITKGIESIAVKKNWSSKKLALYWLDKEYHQTYSRLDDSLYEPIF
jgi:hypothetical protein